MQWREAGRASWCCRLMCREVTISGSERSVRAEVVWQEVMVLGGGRRGVVLPGGGNRGWCGGVDVPPSGGSLSQCFYLWGHSCRLAGSLLTPSGEVGVLTVRRGIGCFSPSGGSPLDSMRLPVRWSNGQVFVSLRLEATNQFPADDGDPAMSNEYPRRPSLPRWADGPR